MNYWMGIPQQKMTVSSQTVVKRDWSTLKKKIKEKISLMPNQSYKTAHQCNSNIFRQGFFFFFTKYVSTKMRQYDKCIGDHRKT